MRSTIVTFRVIFALMLREARVRHGRSRLGYSWSIIEPALLISALTTIFTMVRGQTASTHDFAIFFATGVLPFQYFRNTAQFLATSFDANQPLFNYPPVKPLDSVIARLLLEFATHIVVIVLVLGFQVAVLDADMPHNLPGLLMIVCLITFFGFGAGLNLAILRRQIPSVFNLYLIIMGPAFFVSAVFYSLSSVPTIFREILVWNPLVHVVEGFRFYYFPGYPVQDVDLMYPFWWALTLSFVGVLRDRVEKRGQI